ncbi:hypothetical protein [Asticcacaulis sp. EMRT-3]|uniref:hypothetical protein n=1 Tax=Asticcacaulis sp. EMRT-3 TaxID=3040349 RepID=UPI0024AFEA91|nr:hypothetical protein [Asticcacaulis sp. EMRT-3]MDI7774982.1 hypothetical protein [Asticcacaulis sp. EMRT-3]
MFHYRLSSPLAIFATKTRAPRPDRDMSFARKLDQSDHLRRLCGFDSELYRAIKVMKEI